MLRSDLLRPEKFQQPGSGLTNNNVSDIHRSQAKASASKPDEGALVAVDGPDPARDRILVRMMDVFVSVVMLLFLSPFLLIIALCVFVFDPGPVIFPHRRIGLGGKSFNCYKFRSMYVGAEERLEALLVGNPKLREQWERDQKLEDDPRITPFGSFLRTTSLDELPQLVNVLFGDMSLVGPRPIVAAEVPRYGRFITSYLSVKPGLTGLWQVTGRSTTTYRRRVATDVYYARRKSLKFDVEILLATIPAVLTGKGSM